MSLVDNIDERAKTRLAHLIKSAVDRVAQKTTPTHTLLNNPFNLERGTNYLWKGEIPHSGRFVKFSSPDLSVRAFYKTMRTYWKRGLTSIDSIFSRYAPEMSKSESLSYKDDIIHLMREVGVNVDLGSILKSEHLPALARAVAIRESGFKQSLAYYTNILKQLNNEKQG